MHARHCVQTVLDQLATREIGLANLCGREGPVHHTPILRSQASRAFTAVVGNCANFRGLKNPPTLYERKSLGIAQLRNASWSKEQV